MQAPKGGKKNRKHGRKADACKAYRLYVGKPRGPGVEGQRSHPRRSRYQGTYVQRKAQRDCDRTPLCAENRAKMEEAFRKGL